MLNSCRAVFELSSLSSPVRNTSAALLSTYVEASETLVHRPGSERSSRINVSPFVVSFVDRIRRASCIVSHFAHRLTIAHRFFSPIIVSIVVPVSCVDHRSEHRTQFPCGVHRSSFDTFVQSSVAEFVGYCSIGLTIVEFLPNGERSGLGVTEKSRLHHH